MSKELLTPYQQFHHNCKWQWLNDRVAQELWWERVRLSIESLKPRGLKVSPELQKLLRLK